MATPPKVTITAKTITKKRLLEMVEGLGLGIPLSEIQSVTITRQEIIVSTPLQTTAEGFLESRDRTIPVVG